MRALILALLATPALAGPVLAETDASALIAAEGLAGAEAVLASLPEPTPSERFALGGVRFLGGVERALQLRYRVGLSEGLAVLSGLPVLRLPLPENPTPEPFEPAMIAELFETVSVDMAEAAGTLQMIEDGDEVAVTIDMADLWFDVDADGARGPGEGVTEVAATLLDSGFGFEEFDEFGNLIPPAEPGPPPVVRFDTADAAWLKAYAHLLGAASQGVLALEPTDAIGRVVEARAAFGALPPVPDPYGFALEDQFGATADLLAMALEALAGAPDPTRTRAVRDGLLLVVAENRRFWRLVARETDDAAEWIPNKAQVSATGLPFPPDTGPVWLAVLDDAEAVLLGETLVPFWRVGPGAGLDLGAMLEDPPDLGLAGLVQGHALVPYLREGPLADGSSLRLFSEMVGGRTPLYAAVLN